MDFKALQGLKIRAGLFLLLHWTRTKDRGPAWPQVFQKGIRSQILQSAVGWFKCVPLAYSQKEGCCQPQVQETGHNRGSNHACRMRGRLQALAYVGA